MMRTILIE